jgi:hypothetical protein
LEVREPLLKAARRPDVFVNGGGRAHADTSGSKGIGLADVRIGDGYKVRPARPGVNRSGDDARDGAG